MTVAGLVQLVSQALNRVMLGARIENDRDFNSQLNTMVSAYAANLVLLLVPTTLLFVLSGRYDPFHAPFDGPALRTILAIANPTTFVLMFLASLSWVMHDDAIERARAARQRTGFFFRTLSVLLVPSLVINAVFCVIFFAASFRFLDFGTVIASVACNCFFLLALFGLRNLRREA